MVGTGPGAPEHISPRAMRAIEEAGVIVGYKTYIDLISDYIGDREVVSTGMTREIDRCKEAIARASQGAAVTLVSSGDPGVYGMAGLVLELLERDNLLDAIDIEIIPGITSATAAASCLGAPLMHDFVVISLSDLLTPWDLIVRRLGLASQGDFVMVLYNPASRKRRDQIRTAREIMKIHKDPDTPVGIVRNAAREGQEVILTTLEDMLQYDIDMLCTVIVGNRSTRRSGKFMITPRGYRV